MIAMTSAAMAAVSIGFGDYDPPRMEVLSGDTVTWTNGGGQTPGISYYVVYGEVCYPDGYEGEYCL